MATEWAGLINTTSKKELYDAEDRTIRGRYMLAKMKKEGRIVMDGNGRSCTWQIEVFEKAIQSYGDGQTIDFTRTDRYRQMELDWRGYVVDDMMTKKEERMNRGVEALINRYSEVIPNLIKDMRNKFGTDELWLDGNAAGNEDRLHGIESFMATAQAAAAADKVADPGDTYGNLSTALNTFGGTWTSDLTTSPNANAAVDWPEGKGDSSYDATSPKLINWSSNNWGTNSTSWEDNCERAIRYGRTFSAMTGGKDGSPQAVLMSGGLYNDFLNKQQSVFRNIIPHKDTDDLGFSGEYVNFEGAVLTPDFGISPNIGYGVNFQELELTSLFDRLFDVDGPDWDIKTQSHLFVVRMFGNMRFNPKGFFKLLNYA